MIFCFSSYCSNLNMVVMNSVHRSMDDFKIVLLYLFIPVRSLKYKTHNNTIGHSHLLIIKKRTYGIMSVYYY